MVTLNKPPAGDTDWTTEINDNWTTLETALDKGCRVYNSANISVPTATLQALTFDSERYDSDSMHSTASNTSRITFNTAGRYVVGGMIAFAASAGGSFRQALIELNQGLTYIARTIQPVYGGGTSVFLNVSCVYDFIVGDFIELIAFHDAGANLNVNAVSPQSPEFWAQKIG